MLKFSCDLSQKERKPVKESVWGYTLGYFLLLTTRVLWRTISPAWSDDWSNRVVVTVATLGLIDQLAFFRPSQMSPDPKPKIKRFKPNWFSLGAGLGSLIFATQWLFGEVSVLSRWSATGYPHSGPNPNPSGFLVFICLFAGLLLFGQCQKIVFNPVWLLLGTAGLYGTYWLAGNCSFIGGLIAATFLMSVWPHLFSLLPHTTVWLTMAMAMLIYLFEIFFSVWTVAYNFVPGGEFTRELSSFLIIMVAITISYAVWSHRKLEVLNSENHIAFSDVNMSNIFKLAGLLTLITAEGMGVRYVKWTPGKVRAYSKVRL